MSVELSFHGGVERVTGSCFLLKAGGLKILVDCGLFQGGPECDELNYSGFAFDPKDIDCLLLTHGHLDHCGRIPLLAKRGFRGKVVTTSATADIARVVLMDTAHINEEDYAQWKKIMGRRGEAAREPLYTTLEAQDAMGLFDPRAEYGKALALNERVSATFRDAGHILGASFIEVDVKGGPRLLFSGDLGNPGKPIIRDPSPPPEADAVVMETTYAERNHRSFDESVREFVDCAVETFDRGGNVLVPAFAIERAQDLLYVIREARMKGRLPYGPVFLDSPMAIAVTGVMLRHPECFDEETRAIVEREHDPFGFPGLEFTQTPEESRRINDIKSGAVIIAGSGMMTGGRIKHHLKHNVWRKECSLVVVGYQAEGTLGRRIVDGEREIKIFEQTFRVSASVHTIGGFSSHAGRDDLLGWLKKTGRPSHAFLVHGEEAALRAFAEKIESDGLAGKAHVPAMNEGFTL
jgi:metallo-beta-lactamase family protein